MNRTYFSVLFAALFIAANGLAKGREPGERKGFGWDDTRVRRGSPANPNPSYQPPQFETYGPAETREEAPPEKPAAEKQKKSRKAKEEPPVEETWTVEGGAVQSQTPSSGKPATATTPPPPVTPPSTTLESGEQALPENDTPDKLPPPPTKP